MTVLPAIDPGDWVTLWQSELAALAVDRECHEQVAAAALAWASDDAAGRASADAPPGASSAGLAPGPGSQCDVASATT